MKNRAGFVSNSSSSSFIVDLYENKKRTKEEVQEIMKRVEAAAKLLDIPFSDNDYEIIEDTKEYYESWFDDGDYELKKIKEMDDKFITVMSSGDNSIPYSLFEIMENILNTSRIHLG